MTNYFGSFPQELLQGISLGYVAGVTHKLIVGINNVAPQNQEETIWTAGGLYVFPDNSGVNLQVNSTNSSDNGQIVVFVLDRDFLEHSITITLNGTTPVNIPGTWARVLEVRNNSSISILGNVNIYLSGNPGTIYARVEGAEDVQKSHMCVYTIPSNKTGLIYEIGAFFNKGSASASARIRIRSRKLDKVSMVDFELGIRADGNSSLDLPLKIPKAISSKTDIMLTVNTSRLDFLSLVPDPSISGFLSLVLVDKKYYDQESSKLFRNNF